MPGIKGRSGGHNRKTNREKQILGAKKERISFNAPAHINAPMLEFEGLGEHGKKLWQLYAAMLKGNGTLSATDSAALHQLCNAAEQWHKADEEVKKLGRNESLFDKSGKVIGTRPSGLHKIERDLHTSYIQLLREFGLTPLHRDDIKKLSADEPINPFGGITK